MRCILATTLGLCAATMVGCPAPSDVPDDAGLDAAVREDAPDDAGRDAPWPPDAGYDSGASCARDGDVDAGAIAACNGHPALCDRRYDEVAIVMTHNAMSSEEEGWISPNQHRRLWRQLEDGVRGFMLDVYVDEGVVSLCHGLCALGRRPLADALRDLRIFLDCHPHEVVTIVLEAHASEADVARAFAESGLERHVFTPEVAPGPGVAWPTLRALIASGERVIVFTDDTARAYPWQLHSYDWAWENPYAARTPTDLSCDEDRGSRDRSLWIFNHFLTAPLASPTLADMINHDPFFTERVAACRGQAGGDLPNFVTVDFYDLGDVFAVVDGLNGLGS
jgi:hypothetical protein